MGSTAIKCILATTFFVVIVYAAFNMYDRNKHLNRIFIRPPLNEKLNDIIGNKSIVLSQDFIRKNIDIDEEQFTTHWLRIIKHYIPLPLESGYGSHKLALLAASILTTANAGPVVEMGCGYHSTLLLHQIIVNEQKRFLLSTDTDREWLSKFEANMTSSLHQFRHIKETSEWDTIGNDRPRWSIVFVDHKPGERRVIDIIRLANLTDVMIIHDTESAGYNYERGLSQYPYRYRYNYLSTHSDVVSKQNETLFRNIRRLLELTISMKLPKQ